MNKMYLSDMIGRADIDTKPIKAGFGSGIMEAAEKNEKIVALCADLTGSTALGAFAEKYSQRYFEVGIAEQNLATSSAGLARMGYIPFCTSYAAFSPGRNWEQIKTTACLNDMPVKVVGSHAGLYTGQDGATHQMLEDIAIMRVIPNMVVIAPCDATEAHKATIAMAKDSRPNYLRLAREASAVFTTDETPFEIGKAAIFKEGTDVTIIATGTMTYNALLAAESLAKDNIHAEVIHCATIKPLDEGAILKSAQKTGRVITVEEAQIAGGLGGAVAELLSEKHPVPVKRLGVKDRFGETGHPDELLRAHGLTSTHIALAVHELKS